MSDTDNPFRGLVQNIQPDLAPAVTPQTRKPRMVSEDDVVVQLSVRVRKRARKKLRADAEAAGLSMQDYLERLILEGKRED